MQYLKIQQKHVPVDKNFYKYSKRNSIMKILQLIFLSSLTTWGCHGARAPKIDSPKARIDDIPIRTFMMVEYDYKLETNTSSTKTTDSEREDNIFSDNHPLEDALIDIDTDLIATIQDRIPNGVIQEGQTMPDVEFTSVNSRFINMCFTESDACKWVKSRIKLSFIGNRPKFAMERVTMSLVREYLQDINESNPSINAMFVYPMIHSSNVQFEFSPVDGLMTDSDLEALESSFYNVYNAIVAELDGDTDVTEGLFVYQDVNELPGEEQGNKLSVDLKYYGKCRYCSEAELAEVVNQSIESNLDVFLRLLKKESNNSTYFQQAEEISFSVPKPPEALPPINQAIIDTEPPKASKSIPWFLYLGAVAAVIVISTGLIVIAKDQKELRKEDASTGEESSVFEETHHEKGDIEVKGSLGDDSENSSSLRTDSVDSKGMHSDYEVYVY